MTDTAADVPRTLVAMRSDEHPDLPIISVPVTAADAKAIKERIRDLHEQASALPDDQRQDLIVAIARPGKRRAQLIRCPIAAAEMPDLLEMIGDADQ